MAYSASYNAPISASYEKRNKRSVSRGISKEDKNTGDDSDNKPEKQNKFIFIILILIKLFCLPLALEILVNQGVFDE